jgi:Orn/Lys/Arg decarboxylase, N-terminal domain
MQQSVPDDDYAVLFARPERISGPAARTLASRLVARGLPVINARTWEDLRSAIAAHARDGTARIGAALVSWDLLGSEGELEEALDEFHQLSFPPPVVLVSERADERTVPPDVAGRTAGSFWLHADSPNFVADQVEWLVRTYALRSQVLGVLAAEGNPATDRVANPAAQPGGAVEPGVRG